MLGYLTVGDHAIENNFWVIDRASLFGARVNAIAILRERTKTDDDALPAEAFQAAVAKARELGWIA